MGFLSRWKKKYAKVKSIFIDVSRRDSFYLSAKREIIFRSSRIQEILLHYGNFNELQLARVYKSCHYIALTNMSSLGYIQNHESH